MILLVCMPSVLVCVAGVYASVLLGSAGVPLTPVEAVGAVCTAGSFPLPNA